MGLRADFQSVAAELARGRCPPSEAVSSLQAVAAGTDLASTVAELTDRLGGQPPPEVHRWLTAERASADLFHDVARHLLDRAVARTATAEQVPCWGWSWLAEGCVAAYEATGQARFAGLVLDGLPVLFDNRDHLKGRTDVLRGRPVRSWGVPTDWWSRHRRGNFASGWTASVDAAGRVAHPVLRLARVLAEEGRPIHDSAPGSSLVDACAAALREFDEDFLVVPGRGGFYRRRQLGDVEPLNHGLAAGRALVELAALTGAEEPRGKAVAMARYFRTALRGSRRRGYVWPYQSLPEDPPASRQRQGRKPNRTWKADVDMAFAVTCHEHGLEFTAADLDGFVATFTRGVVLPDGQINSYISRQRKQRLLAPGASETERLRAPGVVSWNLLGRWDPVIHHHIDEAVADHPAVFPDGWFTTRRTTGAYAERLLASSARPTERPRTLRAPRWLWPG